MQSLSSIFRIVMDCFVLSEDSSNSVDDKLGKTVMNIRQCNNLQKRGTCKPTGEMKIQRS